MKNLEFETNYFQDEDGVFTAQVPAIPGCVAWGRTLEEACQAAVEAIESCLEAWRTVHVQDEFGRRPVPVLPRLGGFGQDSCEMTKMPFNTALRM